MGKGWWAAPTGEEGFSLGAGAKRTGAHRVGPLVGEGLKCGGVVHAERRAAALPAQKQELREVRQGCTAPPALGGCEWPQLGWRVFVAVREMTIMTLEDFEGGHLISRDQRRGQEAPPCKDNVS